MNKILLALALLGVVNLVYCVNYPQTPAGFRNLDNYGTDFVTRKTYYRSNALGIAQDHQVICGNAGLTTLSLDSSEEFQHFFALIRVRDVFGWMGAIKGGNFYYWKSTGGWINYPMQWYPGHPVQEADQNCLIINNAGVESASCIANIGFYFCQKVGP